ncbi:zinc finger protein 655 isoform X5 [Halichoerus grypus]|uniref:Zinc finger protein 655 isoform X3 n=1 Tax=Neomonachus schauinslandi TaxID=29088 RepID=A0A2Y9GA94_NEOSC|nr:zinc finger protein 655 isoform X3 [Neomonachus schauinslandi]XP_032249929.1 zinc finger protein 655 isoform X3 [Phoca vitulina]XP_032249930.1 zinc finger protein 655 isoform X3 [Phoca vitulina]XP_035920697.1 zinc finger protein 655 isoform X8 [Halichoerus grypus]XP_035920698.1 zinc finger protein 655 isoform X8 [Halichoerus grypus]
MEELSAQEAAGSPAVQFQSLESLSEGLSPEPPFVQDTDMEQELNGGILLRLPTTRIHSVNSCPALSHTQASAFSGETLAVLSAGISKRWPKYRLPIDIARPRSETPFPRL